VDGIFRIFSGLFWLPQPSSQASVPWPRAPVRSGPYSVVGCKLSCPLFSPTLVFNHPFLSTQTVMAHSGPGLNSGAMRACQLVTAVAPHLHLFSVSLILYKFFSPSIFPYSAKVCVIHCFFLFSFSLGARFAGLSFHYK
jgi:hypothetical protein